LEARAITAWEILDREGKKPVELLVLKEAGEGLTGVDFKSLFKRRRSWHALFILPLFVFWLLFVWLDVRVDSGNEAEGARLASLASRLREFSRALQDRAKSQGLAESLKVAQALEEAAEKSLKGETSERKLGEQLAGMVGKDNDIFPSGEVLDPLFAGDTREGLADLKAELEALKSLSFLQERGVREQKPGAGILGSIGTFPRLNEEIGKRLLTTEGMGQKEFQSFLEQLEKDATAELDRRTLQEIEMFLNLLLQGRGREGESLRLAEPAGQGDSSEAEKVRGVGPFPGDQPGTRESTPQSNPTLREEAVTRLHGLLGEGKSSTMTFWGEFSGKKSVLPREELLSTYRRKAEEELASERIPEELRETVR